jgi:4-hydroxy-tetrahydrodipicolinate synthase
MTRGAVLPSGGASTRRGFLGAAAAAGAAWWAAGSAPVLAQEAAPARAVAPAGEASSAGRPHPQFQARLLGPIYSSPCPFTADLQPDHDAHRRGIDRAARAGVAVFTTTAGNTKYATLSYEEVKAVNRTLVEAVAGRGLAIAATGDWPVEQAIDFARFAEGVGASAVQVLIPVKLREKEQEDAAVDFYAAVGKATRLPLVLHGKFSDALLARLVALDAVAAMKEDHALEDFVRQQIDHGHRITLFGGGGENRFYVGWPFGCQAYYATYSTFAPDIAVNVWRTIQSGDIRAAAALTAKHDFPFIRTFTHPRWHATLELFGVGTRHVREPHKPLTDEQVADLRGLFARQGIDPTAYRAG